MCKWFRLFIPIVCMWNVHIENSKQTFSLTYVIEIFLFVLNNKRAQKRQTFPFISLIRRKRIYYTFHDKDCNF